MPERVPSNQPVTFDQQYGRHVRIFWDSLPVSESPFADGPPYSEDVEFSPSQPQRPYDWEVDGE